MQTQVLKDFQFTVACGGKTAVLAFKDQHQFKVGVCGDMTFDFIPDDLVEGPAFDFSKPTTLKVSCICGGEAMSTPVSATVALVCVALDRVIMRP
jgi:hypothetical protein